MMKVIERKASDNKYLHRDFHISMNLLMQYICDEFGAGALTEYLVQFSKAFHSQRTENMKTDGLECLRKYFTEIYEKEEWPVSIVMGNDVLTISQDACPGITYLEKNGHKPVAQYIETYTMVYKTMCEGTPYEYIMENFTAQTGACRQRFQRRQS